MTTMAKPINVEKELQRLWHETQEKDHIHASLFNLIVYTQDNERKSIFEKLVNSLVSKFPCRIIFVTSNENLQKDETHTEVSLKSIAQAEVQIFCEQISMEVSGKNNELTFSSILPNILPDLPCYLLWGFDPTLEIALLHKLSPLVQNVVFDGTFATNLHLFFQTLLQFIKKDKIAAMDIQWTALAGWRKIIAGAFNNPENLLQLAQCKKVRIYYNSIESSSKHPFLKAIYLQGWLASRLDWNFLSMKKMDDRWRIVYQNSSEIFIELIPQEISGLPCEAIVHVEIECSRDDAYYSFKRNLINSQVCIYQSTSNQCYLPHVANFPQVSPGQEVLNDLFINESDESYQNILEILAQTNGSAYA